MKYSINPSRFYRKNVAIFSTEYGLYQLLRKKIYT